jgi:glycosyltransferase involved in cell wall biosynthesis
VKVVTSCYGRFHIFDQAQQLYRYGVLEKLVTAYPKFMTRRWGIPNDKVISLLANGIYGRIAHKGFRWMKRSTQSLVMESIHHQFSNRLARYLPLDSDIFIGLSSYCLEAIVKAKDRGIVTIVDHGSLHQRVERRLQIEESDLWGLPVGSHLPPDWIIEKEAAEFRAADRVMVLSRIAKQSMVEEGIPADKVFVNHCGVNLGEFKPGRKLDKTFRIIQCGGIHQGKGIQYLLRAFTELKLPNSELWFIGGGLETSTLRPIIGKYNADNIHFKGVYPQQELHKLYTQGSVFVLASIADGFGMVVPQAMACGLPVIVTDHVGAADVVSDGENGYVMPVRDVETLKERILRLYQDRDLCQEMGRNALKSVSSGHAWNDYGDRLLKELKAIAN